ncbi:RCC1-like G exchanging factor-like protein [Anneissia japonica]|uniref:RCC1-like G exchanging factor-like protein n=1 Tax=Anneissia japonica TaxID=1529436 RepID=UPI0014255674|nr:RCC1-like G exchanging factor-like protein [Anneissia japonica]XP_033099715.1 RCC1-like G exchanging factor-like protein [Anneissia japonica]
MYTVTRNLSILKIFKQGIGTHGNWIFFESTSIFVDRIKFSISRVISKQTVASSTIYRENSNKYVNKREAEELPVYQFSGDHRQRKHRVYVWGNSVTGSLGVPTFVKPKPNVPIRKKQTAPYLLFFEEKITDVACGYGFSLFSSNGPTSSKLWGTGINTDSQLGYHEKQVNRGKNLEYLLAPAEIHLPLKRPRSTRVIQVACGRAHSLVLTDQEGVFSLGNNAYGQCGRKVVENEDYSSNMMIHKISGIEDKVAKIVCGQDHSLFLTEGGQVLSCGWGADGQTGQGDYESSSKMSLVGGDLKGERIVDIATYADCCLAVSDKGDVFGWGNSEYNQLNLVTDETQIAEPRLLPFKNVGKVVSIATGGTICALLNDAGDVYVWGYGILGKGPKLSESIHLEHIPPILFGRKILKEHVKVTQIHCGMHHFAALTNTGEMYTWGQNAHGSLGLGFHQDQYFPLKVGVPAEVIDVACGVDHTIALAKTFI